MGEIFYTSKQRRENLRRFAIEGRRLGPIFHEPIQAFLAFDIGKFRNWGGAHRRPERDDGILWIDDIQQGLANNAPRVVLARVKFLPLYLVEVFAEFVLHPRLGSGCHVTQASHQTSELRCVMRQAFRAQQEHRDDPDYEEFIERQTKHTTRLPPRNVLAPLFLRPRRT